MKNGILNIQRSPGLRDLLSLPGRRAGAERPVRLQNAKGNFQAGDGD